MPTIAPAPHERSSVHRARFQIANVVAAALATTAAEAAAKLRRRKRRENDDDEIDDDVAINPDEITKGVDMSDIVTPVTVALGYVYLEQVSRTLAKIVDLSDIEPEAKKAAVKSAQDQAARLVGKKYAPDGALIDNPNPKWSITQSTRDLLNNIISDGVAQNQSREEIATRIQTSTGFSPDRARLIAVTESSTADNSGFLLALKSANGKGRLKLRKSWITGGDNPCQVCLDNEAAGAIDLDDDFDSGDSAPPGHPGCFCSVAAVTGDSD
jgi:hypothetical protein